jgi:hypothetical protein
MDIGRCVLPVSMLVPLIEKHKNISVRSSCLTKPADSGQGSNFILFPTLFAQPRLEQIHLSGRHPNQCRGHYPEARGYVSAAQSIQGASITCLFIKGQYSTNSIQHWTPLLRGLPNLHTLTLHLKHNYSPEPFDKPEHWKVRQKASWVQPGVDSCCSWQVGNTQLYKQLPNNVMVVVWC